jgi:hypothetical protein
VPTRMRIPQQAPRRNSPPMKPPRPVGRPTRPTSLATIFPDTRSQLIYSMMRIPMMIQKHYTPNRCGFAPVRMLERLPLPTRFIHDTPMTATGGRLGRHTRSPFFELEASASPRATLVAVFIFMLDNSPCVVSVPNAARFLYYGARILMLP